MELDFDRAGIELKDGGVWLCLRVKSSFNARRFVSSMRDKLYTADLKEKRKKRSLSANAYFWTLCGKLASALGIPSHEYIGSTSRKSGTILRRFQSKTRQRKDLFRPGNLMVLAFYVKNWRKPRPDIPRLRPIMVLQPTIPGKCQISLIWWFSTARNRGLKPLLPMN